MTITRDSDNTGLFTVNGTTIGRYCHPTKNISINLPSGVYTIRNLGTQTGIANCQINYPDEGDGLKYLSEGTFTLDSDTTCQAYISIEVPADTPISDVKVGCVLNSGSVALPFSEYTDVAVVN